MVNRQTYGSPRVFQALKREGISTSEKRVARLMRENGIRPRALKTYSKPAKVKFFYKASMNRPGCCTDNAEVESFFHSLKADLIRGDKFDTIDKLHSKLKGYMNYFYNRQRLHSSLGYKTPAEYELAVN